LKSLSIIRFEVGYRDLHVSQLIDIEWKDLDQTLRKAMDALITKNKRFVIFGPSSFLGFLETPTLAGGRDEDSRLPDATETIIKCP